MMNTSLHTPNAQYLLTLSTPDGQHVNCLTIAGRQIGSAVIRFANSHGMMPACVDVRTFAQDSDSSLSLAA